MLTEKQEREKLKASFLKSGAPEDVAEFAAQTFPLGLLGDAIMTREQRAKVEQLQLKALEQQKQ